MRSERIKIRQKEKFIPLRSREVIHLTVNSEGDMKKEVYDADNDGVVDFAKDLALTNEDWAQFNLILLS